MPFGTPAYVKIPERIRKQRHPTRFQNVAEQMYVIREDPGINEGSRAEGRPGYELVKITPGEGKKKDKYNVITSYDVRIDPINIRRQLPLQQRISKELEKRLSGKQEPIDSNKEDVDPVGELQDKLHCDPEEEALEDITKIIPLEALFDPLFNLIKKNKVDLETKARPAPFKISEEGANSHVRRYTDEKARELSSEITSYDQVVVVVANTHYEMVRMTSDRVFTLSSNEQDFREEKEELEALQDILPTRFKIVGVSTAELPNVQ